MVTDRWDTLSDVQVSVCVLLMGAAAFLTALFPLAPHTVDHASYHTHLVRQAGGLGAATVIGGGGGDESRRTGMGGVMTVTHTLVRITALRLFNGQPAVGGTSRWNLERTLLFLTGTVMNGLTLSRVSQHHSQTVFTARNLRQLATHQVTHTLVFRTTLGLPLLPQNLTGSTRWSFMINAGASSAVDMLTIQTHTNQTRVLLWHPAL